MKKTGLKIAAAVSLLLGGCSAFVKADRSKVADDLYRPADFGDGGDAAGADGEVEVDAGADAAVDAGADASTDGLDGANDATGPADAGAEAGDANLVDLAGDLPGLG